MFLKVIVNNNEHDVVEVYSKYSLYDKLKEFKLKNLSAIEYDEFSISKVKSVIINSSVCLSIDELLFTNTDDILCGVRISNGRIKTITECNLNDVVVLEIEV